MKDRIWEEISIKNLKHNIDLIKSMCPGKTLILLMKDNAYGHGACEIATRLQKDKDILGYAVASIGEALKLRDANVTKNIIVISHTYDERYSDCILNNIITTVSTYDEAKKISDKAVELDVDARIEIALDTGMGRIGFDVDEEKSFSEVYEISKLPRLSIHGFFSHFSVCDEDLENDVLNKNFTDEQEKKFNSFIEKVDKAGIKYRYSSLSNSAGILTGRGIKATSVRPGIILYGIAPSEYLSKYNLKPVMELKARIMHIKDVKSHTSISYGRTFITEKPITVATIGCGYGDGYPRTASNKAYVLVNGHKCKVLGRVTMDMLMIDVTGIPCKLYDIVTLIGKDNGSEITIKELSDITSEFHYELLTRINHRVEKIYID